MRGWINDALRSAIGISLRIAGAPFELRHRWRIRCYGWSQARLRRRYRIGMDTPISDNIGLPRRRAGAARIHAPEKRCPAWTSKPPVGENLRVDRSAQGGSLYERAASFSPIHVYRRVPSLFLEPGHCPDEPLCLRFAG